jgi:predicted metal-binding membrane protein
MEAAAQSYPLPRERAAILVALMALAAAAWAWLGWQWAVQDEMDMGLTMGMGSALFLGTWVVMMVAMMFPTAAPMILAFARVQAGKEQRGQAFVPTWLFVAAYLALWSVAGVVAYLGAEVAQRLADESMWLMDNGARIGGGVIVLAGVYQLSPLKRVCLSRCRTPMSFVLTSWRDGRLGAVRMGLQHGAYCLGCCWFLFAILFPLGIMNVAAMAVITLLIFAEKSLPLGATIARGAAVALLAFGLLVVFVPGALPTAM